MEVEVAVEGAEPSDTSGRIFISRAIIIVCTIIREVSSYKGGCETPALNRLSHHCSRACMKSSMSVLGRLRWQQ